ncbi:hypothetical protein EW146_g8148 [Bondarzewia mesenterica]|uniref:DUF6534 domain-containing protein n=1 Tax=Bondarzewia mesenterica TaxID=1095465 RepID=A0A4V3XDU9_9AGAM|nr:hypothetical protein EW146_g8148 [Bondarzewia mesenterica]
MTAGSPTIDSTIGAAFIGWGVSSLVFGVLCIQVWSYFQRYPRDNIAYKLLVSFVPFLRSPARLHTSDCIKVGALWLLELLHQAMVGHCVYHYAVSNFGNVLAFTARPVWTLSLQVTVGAIVGTVVKICFGMRVWKFSKGNYVITGFIVIMALVQLGFAFSKSPHMHDIDHTCLMHDYDTSSIFHQITIATTSLALGVTTDIFTAAALSYFLHKMRTGYTKSDTLINQLILYSVNNGFLTSVCSLAVVILYNIMPTNFIFMGMYFVLSKLYANSCLSTLNTRRFVRGKGTDREEGTGPTFLMVGNFQGRSQARQFDEMHKTIDGGSVSPYIFPRSPSVVSLCLCLWSADNPAYGPSGGRCASRSIGCLRSGIFTFLWAAATCDNEYRLPLPPFRYQSTPRSGDTSPQSLPLPSKPQNHNQTAPTSPIPAYTQTPALRSAGLRVPSSLLYILVYMSNKFSSIRPSIVCNPFAFFPPVCISNLYSSGPPKPLPPQARDASPDLCTHLIGYMHSSIPHRLTLSSRPIFVTPPLFPLPSAHPSIHVPSSRDIALSHLTLRRFYFSLTILNCLALALGARDLICAA